MSIATRRVPMNPVAPVTRIGSFTPSSNSPVEFMSRLFSDVRFANRPDADERQQPADVVAEFDEAGHEAALPEEQRKRKKAVKAGPANDRFPIPFHPRGG